jgi:hypothetical protein
MKNLLLIPISVLFFTACTKEQPVAKNARGCNQAENTNARKFQDFNYVLTKDSDGNYSCPTPKVDCTKISPDPTLVFSIDIAIANGSVQDFFNQDDWAARFPYLNNQETVVVGLQNGSYTMIRETNSNDNNIFYIVVSASDQAETIYTTMIDASL